MEQQKLAALTFDDGPTIGITDQVLDILEENDVKANYRREAGILPASLYRL